MSGRRAISHSRVIELVSYDPESGRFIWVKTGRHTKAGAEAGSMSSNGYRRVNLERIEFLAHRLAWFWMTKEWPKAEIDHINGDKADNRWVNLREANRSQNKANTRSWLNSASGMKGVHRHPGTRKWRASIQVNGKTLHLGYFEDASEAKEAYERAAIHHFGEFASTRGG